MLTVRNLFIKKALNGKRSVSMNKVFLFMLLFFFICGSFVVVFSSVSASSELVEDSWNTKMSMSQARYGLGVIAVDDKIYAIGGSTLYGYDNSGFVGTNECYDPKTDTWVTMTAMPTRRAHFAIAASQGKIYCIGGSAPDEKGDWIACNVNEVYDTTTDSWSTKASPSVNGARHASVVKGKIFVIQGGAMYMYDPITDTWIQKASMSKPFMEDTFNSACVSVVVDDKIIVIGDVRVERLVEYIGTEDFIQITIISSTPRVMIYDPKTDVWSEKEAWSVCEYDGAGVTTGHYAPQKVYLINQVYDPVSDTWSVTEAIPTTRSDFGVAVVDDILYVIGGSISLAEGYSTLVPSSLNEQYVPIGYSALPTVTFVFSLNNPIVIALILMASIFSITFLYLKFKKLSGATNREHIELVS